MLTVNAVAAVLVFVFTTVLTIAGVGSAFIVIPTFYWLGVPLTEAMAIGLLLNAISMAFASANYIRYKLVLFRTAIPIIVLAVVFSPLVRTRQGTSRTTCLFFSSCCSSFLRHR